MKPSDNEIETLAAGFAIQHKNGLIRFAHALLEKYASARASTVAGEATYYAVMHGNALYGIFDTEAAAEACKAQGHPDAPFSVKPLYAAPQASAEPQQYTHCEVFGPMESAWNAALDQAAAVAKRISDKYAFGHYGNETDTADEIEREILALKQPQADKDGGQQRAGDEKEPQ